MAPTMPSAPGPRAALAAPGGGGEIVRAAHRVTRILRRATFGDRFLFPVPRPDRLRSVVGTIVVVSGSASSPARPIPTVMLLTLALLSATAPLSIDMYLPAMPSIGSALQTDDSVVQLTLTTFMIGLAIGQ